MSCLIDTLLGDITTVSYDAIANAANTTPSSPALIQFFHVLPVEETLCPQKLIQHRCLCLNSCISTHSITA